MDDMFGLSIFELCAWTFSFIVLLIVLANSFIVKEEVATFVEYEALLEETYNGGEIEDYAINNQVIELNKWLSEVRSKVDVYGKFSFYYGKVEHLEYLSLKE